MKNATISEKEFVEVATNGNRNAMRASGSAAGTLTGPYQTDERAIRRNQEDGSSVQYLRGRIDLGVLGGMGPQATQYFVEELLRSVELKCKPRRDQDYPSVVVRFACYLPDRTTALEGDIEQFAKAFTSEANALLEMGCPKIVVPCITAHAVIQPRMSHLPVVNLPRVVAAHLRREKPGARFGVLATRGTHLAGVINKFTQAGQNVMVLAPKDEAELMSVIYEKAKFWQGLKDLSEFGRFADRLREMGCDAVVAGCTEVEMCLARCGRDSSDLIFPLRIVAEEFSDHWSRRST